MIKKDIVTLCLERLMELGKSEEEAIYEMNRILNEPMEPHPFLSKAPMLIAEAIRVQNEKIKEVLGSEVREL